MENTEDLTLNCDKQRGRKRSLSNGSVHNETEISNCETSGIVKSNYDQSDQQICSEKPVVDICDLNHESKPLYIKHQLMENDIDNEASALFEKKFHLTKKEEYNVPAPKDWFCENAWEVHSLKELKYKLNCVKEWLNDMELDWHEHTSRTNKAGCVIRKVREINGPEMVTQAWCKFYEILSAYKIVPDKSEQFLSLHLCEAPGAFITALNYYLWATNNQVMWKWIAGTLNPYYEGHSSHSAITDDRLIFSTFKNWEFGKDCTGDIMNVNYLTDLKDKLGSNLCNLVTADGSIDCFDNPGEQENIVAALHYAEVVTALSLLAPGGSFVIKKFTLYECISVCIMYMLVCFFHEVNVFKPATSKAGNSEVYVVCLGYLGPSLCEPYLNVLLQKLGPNNPKEAMFPKESIPQSFLENLTDCCKMFMNFQQTTIKENLEFYYQGCFQETKKYLSLIRESVASKYSDMVSLKTIKNSPYNPLLKSSNTFRHWNSRMNPRNMEYVLFKGSFNHQQTFRKMAWKERLSLLEEKMAECFCNSDAHDKQWSFTFPGITLNGLNNSQIIVGKPYVFVKNSKFVESYLIELWNDISCEAEILKNSEFTTVKEYSWGLEKCALPSTVKVLVPFKCVTDPIRTAFQSLLPSAQVMNFEEMNADENIMNKLFLFNLTSFHVDFVRNEILTKADFIKNCIAAIEVLKEGDCLAMCFHDILTRVTVGVFYLMLSLFKKAVILSSKKDALPTHGNVLVLIGFQQKLELATKIVQHLKYASNCETEEMTVLEVVPITTLCSGSFYHCLWEYNNKSLMKKIRQLIRVEKDFVTKIS